jgi:hypothetical protein
MSGIGNYFHGEEGAAARFEWIAEPIYLNKPKLEWFP